MSITRAIVGTTTGPGRFGPEEHTVIQALQARGIPFVEGTVKMIQRRKLVPDQETLVVGAIPMVHESLRVLGIQPPDAKDYPQELIRFLHRRVWTARLGDASVQGCFVKPKRLKRFTGKVLNGRPDPFLFNNASLRTEVWASEAVHWVSEWRCFVAHGCLQGIRNYDGDPLKAIDTSVVQEAINLLTTPPGGYALDFGVLSTGETALVEMNNGYALGSYGLEPAAYLHMLEACWTWMMQGKSTTKSTTDSSPSTKRSVT